MIGQETHRIESHSIVNLWALMKASLCNLGQKILENVLMQKMLVILFYFFFVKLSLVFALIRTVLFFPNMGNMVIEVMENAIERVW